MDRITRLEKMFLFFFLATFLSLFFSASNVGAMTVVVPLHDQVCFHEDFTAGENATITYQVDEGHALEIDFWVTSPKRTTMFIGKREATGQYDLTAPMEGRYQYCFSNKVNSRSERLVQFAIDKMPIPTATKIKDAMSPVLEAMQLFDFNLRTILSEQEYIINRERSHRKTAESSKTRSFWWSCIQIVVLVSVSYFQVRYLKHFFEKKRVL